MSTDRVGAMAIFLQVIAMGSMSEASRRTGLPVSSISRKIGGLEKFLKAALFERRKRKFTLTEAGRTFANAVPSLLREIEDAEKAIQTNRDKSSEKLRLGITTLYGQQKIVPLISEFLNTHDQVGVDLLVADEDFNLVKDSLDMVIQFGQPPGQGLLSIPLEPCRRGLYASLQYLESRGIPAHPGDLEQHDCIVHGTGRDSCRWSFSGIHGQFSVATRPRLIVESAQVAIDMAVAGIGITQLFLHEDEAALTQGHLRPLLREFDEAVSWITLTHAARPMSRSLHLLVDFIISRIANVGADVS